MGEIGKLCDCQAGILSYDDVTTFTDERKKRSTGSRLGAFKFLLRELFMKMKNRADDDSDDEDGVGQCHSDTCAGDSGFEWSGDGCTSTTPIDMDGSGSGSGNGNGPETGDEDNGEGDMFASGDEPDDLRIPPSLNCLNREDYGTDDDDDDDDDNGEDNSSKGKKRNTLISSHKRFRSAGK